MLYGKEALGTRPGTDPLDLCVSGSHPVFDPV